ncbi:FKBP-type peptidyl-prolyl cis-trans isomerase [Fimbriiglobus ruber]|uniref:Peptidyl-prolyl cis-trans isomerase n=1 Tax=Fimbriiglobus ruber TaxID=1908690 RepID=A0A225DRC0_9BACT|nr:FKBP-type peptidyl-prolyl cis-trans isomerase [Fimbriiglobus ruber]OWK43942.1 FKBP-type peptidyl-prolyl cis-trans isomerase SlyD [Fimbriiglobus ruber]
MRTTKTGDRILVHYIKRFEEGTEVSSRTRGDDPMEVTVGTPHKRLPGLNRELVGLAPGQDVVVTIPPGRPYGAVDPERVLRLARKRFPEDQNFPVGQLVRFTGKSGRARSVRVVSVAEQHVVVDTNHPRAGQGLELEIELVAFLAPTPETATS